MGTYRDVAREFATNDGQRRAFEATGSCLVLAGPGSGKTKVLTAKVAKLLSEEIKAPSGLACITYNKDCVRELQTRLRDLGVLAQKNLFVGSAHSFALRHIVAPFAQLSGAQIPFPIKVASLEEQDSAFQNAHQLVRGGGNVGGLRTAFEKYRRTFLNHDSIEFKTTDPNLARIIIEYERLVLSHGVIDFDMILQFGLQLVEGHNCIRKVLRARFPFLVVDEYQDMGLALHRIVMSICDGKSTELLAVADPDQSIYGFAGSIPGLIDELSKKTWIETIPLAFNYRSGKKIIDLSVKVLGKDRQYESKAAHSGSIQLHICNNGIEQQAEFIIGELIPVLLKSNSDLSLGKIAVIYCDKFDGTIITRAAIKHRIPYVRYDKGGPYRRTNLTAWLEDCVVWCSAGIGADVSLPADLIDRWLAFNQEIGLSSERLKLRRDFVEFMFKSRGTQLTLHEWLARLIDIGLKRAVDDEPNLRDEKDSYSDFYKLAENRSDLQLAEFGEQVAGAHHLNLITLHSAKGLEFDIVVLMGMEQGKIPSWSVRDAEQEAEARRLFYVGLTRARQQVHITYSGFYLNQYGRKFVNGPSKFVMELRRQLD